MKKKKKALIFNILNYCSSKLILVFVSLSWFFVVPFSSIAQTQSDSSLNELSYQVYVGEYGRAKVRIIDNDLVIQMGLRTTQLITANEKDTFSIENQPFKIHFIRDSEGNVIALEQVGRRRIRHDRITNQVAEFSSASKKIESLDHVVENIEILLTELSESDQFSGSVILAQGSKPLFARAYGYADANRQVKNSLNTPINIGSITKMFTGLAINQLIEDKRMSVEGKVGDYLREYPQIVVRDNVTVHQLLTHTSGLGDYLKPQNIDHIQSAISVSDLMELIVEESLVANPGDGFRYSNSGPVVLARILEKVTSLDYYDYIDQEIYQIADMTNSGHFEQTENLSGKAIGHVRGNDASTWEPRLKSTFGSAAGGSYSSANDLLKFSVALFADRLIGSEQREVMLEGKVQRSQDVNYAYGFQDMKINGQRYIGHGGGAPGINAEFSVFPKSEITLIVLSNYDRAASPVARQVREWISMLPVSEIFD